jgi:hypothetical protein
MAVSMAVSMAASFDRKRAKGVPKARQRHAKGGHISGG